MVSGQSGRGSSKARGRAAEIPGLRSRSSGQTSQPFPSCSRVSAHWAAVLLHQAGGSCSYTSPWLLGLSCLGPVPRPRSRHPARGCDSILGRPPQEKGSAWPLGPRDMVDGPI